MITKERLKELLHYDPNTGLLTWIKSPNIRIKIGEIAGSKTAKGYIQTKLDKQPYLVHRLAWLYVFGKLPHELDHINQIRSDNRIKNLRIIGRAANRINAKTGSKNSSGIKGVSFNKRKGIWIARIGFNREQIQLGSYTNKEDAALAYKNASMRLYPDIDGGLK